MNASDSRLNYGPMGSGIQWNMGHTRFVDSVKTMGINRDLRETLLQLVKDEPYFQQGAVQSGGDTQW